MCFPLAFIPLCGQFLSCFKSRDLGHFDLPASSSIFTVKWRHLLPAYVHSHAYSGTNTDTYGHQSLHVDTWMDIYTHTLTYLQTHVDIHTSVAATHHTYIDKDLLIHLHNRILAFLCAQPLHPPCVRCREHWSTERTRDSRAGRDARTARLKEGFTHILFLMIEMDNIFQLSTLRWSQHLPC